MTLPWTVIEPSGLDDGVVINAAFSAGVKAIMLAPGEYSVSTQIVMPIRTRLLGQGRTTRLNKAANITTLKMGQETHLEDLQLLGHGDVYSGGGIVIDTTNGVADSYQTIKNVASDARGYGLQCVASDSGGMLRVLNCSFISWPTITLPAIKLPDLDSSVGGNRKFWYVEASGGFLMDLAGADNTLLDGCSGDGIRMNPNCRSMRVTGCRLGNSTEGNLNLHGTGHQIWGNNIAVPWWIHGDLYYTLVVQPVMGSGITRTDQPENGNVIWA